MLLNTQCRMSRIAAAQKVVELKQTHILAAGMNTDQPRSDGATARTGLIALTACQEDEVV